MPADAVVLMILYTCLLVHINDIATWIHLKEGRIVARLRDEAECGLRGTRWIVDSFMLWTVASHL